ncbi:hypothetical protein ABW21_db0205190 [Orbilia brochopaga]|nr:hypothetical protein ABW21_db0205190 [Drechslerella brochopaga]
MTDVERLQFYDERTKLDAQILKDTDVVISTCSNAAASQMRFHFPPNIVLVDEAGQAYELETCTALTSGFRTMRQAILIGDHQQLPPVSRNNINMLKMSMMERMEKLRHKGISEISTSMLKINYRSVPPLVHVFSREFYGNIVEIENIDKLWLATFNCKASILWVDVNGTEYRTPTLSICNRNNAQVVSEILMRLGEKSESIGGSPLPAERVAVITMYKGQVELINELVKKGVKGPLGNCLVSTVDAAQGQEREIIILDLVRSNNGRSIGFLKNLQRINVAISRAKRKMLIVGDIRMFKDNVAFAGAAGGHVFCPAINNLAREALGKFSCGDNTSNCYHDIGYFKPRFTSG